MTTIKTGSDGNHVTLFRCPDGKLVATVDERCGTRLKKTLSRTCEWIGCWSSDDCATVRLPHNSVEVIGAF